ncbi:MAG: DUF4056 domain-containing protein [Saprospiraceae bacterium]|nr:DUF4056 domain-containing protein [Saprospiraceae bacterium]
MERTVHYHILRIWYATVAKKGLTPLLLLLLIQGSSLWATAPVLEYPEMEKVPPRIIRTCCSFGSNLKMVGLPLVKVTQIISISELGEHRYLGSQEEGNGIIYTARGGFIDLGHVRDQADWTAYLFLQIEALKGTGESILPLRYEGGAKSLQLNLSCELSVFDTRLLAGAIAYDISVWHEIATWFGASMVPMIPERYSSFSVEDAYSNVLGITLGIEALKSDLPYDQAMTQLIDESLCRLGAVSTNEETFAAMEDVKDLWWTRNHKLPTRKVLIERDLQVYPEVTPWLVPNWEGGIYPSVSLRVPARLSSGQLLSAFYKLGIKVNHKFPFKKMFPDREDRMVTQFDFEVLLERVEWELSNKDRPRGKKNPSTQEVSTKRKI